MCGRVDPHGIGTSALLLFSEYPEKDTALKYFEAAAKARKATNDAETNKELDAATEKLL